MRGESGVALEEKERDFVFSDWVAEGVEGMASYVPRRAVRLMRELARTVLLADRALVDRAIERLEEQSGPKGLRRIKVE